MSDLVVRGRILAIDFGSKRIGVALSDDLACLARPLIVIERKTGLKNDLATLARIARAEGAISVVVGIPLRSDGTVGPAAERVLAFARSLSEVLPELSIVTRDETLSTWAADDLLKAEGLGPEARKKHIDAYAAAVILQEELDAQAAAREKARALQESSD